MTGFVTQAREYTARGVTAVTASDALHTESSPQLPFWGDPMTRGHVARLAAAFLFVLAIGAEASARTETLRWRHAEPATVAGFRVHWRTAGSTSYRIESVGKPTPDAQGIYSYSVVVDDGVDVYLAMTAYNADNLSSFSSNEICRGPGVPCSTTGGGGTTTPPPTEPPPTSGPQAQIIGFRLWDARTDTIIDNNFTNGEIIPLMQYDCVAIEIVANSYLNSSPARGSVKKQLDGSANSCNQAGVTHENSPPYAWEQDEGPNRFACAVALRASGPHTLTATPFDGADCSGAQGTPVTLQFQTLSLGAPGRPTLVGN